MSRVKRLNLNDYELVDTPKDFEGYNGCVIIIPKRLKDGSQPPEMYWRKTGQYLISDIDNETWTKNCKISTSGSHEEYARKVDWWVDNAFNDPEYKEIINNTFGKYNFNIRMSLDKSIAWLKGRTPSQRKSHLHKFFWNWLLKGYQWAMDRYEKHNRG